MCGIAGLYRSDRETAARLAVMMNRLAHRGPDGHGAWSEEGIALGHCRLAILDLGETGKQPMLSADGRFVCVLNGEIYNYDRLGTALAAVGVGLRGTSDTEVLVESYRRRGPDLIPDLRGMFAVAIWDRERKELILARDHFGKKPLYYTTFRGSGFAFASELTAMAAVIDGGIDTSVISDYLHFGYVPEPRTIYEDVHVLPPGSLAVWRPEAGLRIERYWSVAQLDVESAWTVDLDELDEMIGSAVDRRLHSDVALGSFLSGGVDSALIASYLTERRPGAPTITVGFDITEWDESPEARRTAAMLDTEHVVEVVSMSDAEAMLDRYVACYDQPFADSSGIPMLALAEAARRHVTVALGGDGADEVFGGYDRYRWLRKMARCLSMPGTLRSVCAKALPAVAGHRGRRLGAILEQADRQGMYLELMRVWHATPLEAILHGGVTRPEFEGLDGLGVADASNPQVIDLLNYLPFDILVKVDRATMRHGLESRSPFLDVDLVSWAASGGLLTAHRGRGKSALKELLARRLPDYDTSRPKKGFMLPISDWLAGPLRNRLLDASSNERMGRLGVFRADAVGRIVKTFLAGEKSFAFPLWSFLVFQEWERNRDAGASS
jgi:asparagine synthase (glutamine-hydrolysing)